MHYYQFNIADYRKDTTHLSMLEHGAYRQLLDWHYLEQAPIPRETEVVFRRLSARTEEERLAIQMVLKEMFLLTDDGYIQHRVMREIDAYEAKADRARDNGKLGGRPKKTKEVISGLSNKTQEKANSLTHKPINSITNNKNNTQKNEFFAEFWLAYPKKTAKGAGEKAFIKNKINRETLDLILTALKWQKDSEAWRKGYIPNPATYLNDKRWLDEMVSNTEQPKPNEKPWFLVASAIEAKGKEIGLLHDPSEPFVYFKERVYKAFGITGEMIRKANIDWGGK